MKALLISIITILMVTGCNMSTPDIPKYNIQDSDKVGYIIKNANMSRTHIGFTFFDNFKKEYPPIVSKSEILNLLSAQTQVDLVDLSKYDFNQVDNMVVIENNKWIIKDKKLYQTLVKELGLKAIILIEDTKTAIAIPFGSATIDSSGLVSQHTIGIKRYWAVSGIKSKIILLNPHGVVDIGNRGKNFIINDPLISTYEEKSGFLPPVDIENLTQVEIQILKKSILNLIGADMLDINASLKR